MSREEKKYTFNEIERMRAAIFQLTMLFNFVYSEGSLEREVELKLRTAMLNGTSPDELELEVLKLYASREKLNHV